MKLHDFDATSRKWDEYRAFHHAHTHFVQFETGELIYTLAEPDPGNRHRYSNHNVTIANTADAECPLLFHPETGAKLVRTHLNRGGSQWLAIDHDHKIAVRLHPARHYRVSSENQYTSPIPDHLQGRAAAYWPGPQSEPIGRPIAVSSPTVVTPEQKAHMQGLVDQAHAWATLHQLEVHFAGERVSGLPGPDGKYAAWCSTESHGVRPAELIDKEFPELSTKTRATLWVRGIGPSFTVTRIPFARVTA